MISNAREAEHQAIWDDVLDAKGTAYVFDKRAKRFRFWLNTNNFIGLALPVLVGGIVLGFGNPTWMKIVLPITGGVAVIQFLSTLASFVWGWQSGLEYSLQALSKNESFATDLNRLVKNLTVSDDQFFQELKILRETMKAQSSIDQQRGITDGEKRMGMRWGLRETKRACAACKKIPTSMKSDNCDVCGNF
jgi:mobilome CxxCx(11)CxxC protein